MTKANYILGEKLQVAAWALRGNLPPQKMAQVLEGAVKRMGMTTEGMAPAVWQYPLPSGKGGVGHTIYLPLGENVTRLTFWQRLRLALARLILGRQEFAATVFQPLVESFIVADDYPELGRTYVLAASCKPFVVGMVTRYLTRRVGPIVNFQGLEL